MIYLVQLIMAILFLTPAKADNIEALFNKKDPAYYQEEVSSIYQGTPIIKIEMEKEIIDQNPRPKLELSSLNELKESTPIFNQIYQIKTPFGKKEIAYNLPHTTDFVSTVQVIDNNTVAVQEYIQFVSDKQQQIKRIIPTNYNQNLHPLSIKLNTFEINGKKINYSLFQTKDEFVIKTVKEYPAGLYMIQLDYIVENAIQAKNGVTQLFLSLTGKNWPYPIDRFKAIVLYPYIPVSYQKGLLFGSNNLNIEEGVIKQTDIKGNTIYTITKPIPAFGDIRIFETFDGKYLTKNFNELFFQKYHHLIFSGLACFYLCLYLIISTLYLKKIEKRSATVLKRVNKLSFMTVLLIQQKKVKKSFFEELIKIKKITKKRTYFVRFIYTLSQVKIANSFIKRLLKIVAILGILFKYAFIAGIIYIVAVWPLYEEKAGLIFFIIPLIFFIFILSLFYKKVLYQEIKNDIKQFKEKLLSPHICFGLKESTILAFYLRYYQTAYLLGIDKNLQEIIKTQAPNINLPIIDK